MCVLEKDWIMDPFISDNGRLLEGPLVANTIVGKENKNKRVNEQCGKIILYIEGYSL